MRIEVGIVGFVFVGLCHHLAVPKRQWIGFVLATVFTVFLLIVQTVMANEIPGSGEHGLALSMNLGLDAYWAPYSGVVLLILLINALLFETKIRRRHWFGGVFYLLVAHLTLSAFNDFGSRHTLPSLCIALLLLSRPWWIAPLSASAPLTGTPHGSRTVSPWPEDFAIRVSKDYPSLTVVNEYSEPVLWSMKSIAREPAVSL